MTSTPRFCKHPKRAWRVNSECSHITCMQCYRVIADLDVKVRASSGRHLVKFHGALGNLGLWRH